MLVVWSLESGGAVVSSREGEEEKRRMDGWWQAGWPAAEMGGQGKVPAGDATKRASTQVTQTLSSHTQQGPGSGYAVLWIGKARPRRGGMEAKAHCTGVGQNGGPMSVRRYLSQTPSVPSAEVRGVVRFAASDAVHPQACAGRYHSVSSQIIKTDGNKRMEQPKVQVKVRIGTYEPVCAPLDLGIKPGWPDYIRRRTVMNEWLFQPDGRICISVRVGVRDDGGSVIMVVVAYVRRPSKKQTADAYSNGAGGQHAAQRKAPVLSPDYPENGISICQSSDKNWFIAKYAGLNCFPINDMLFARFGLYP
ncbi:hypothetical protein B0T17DRAFT_598170 [Bombardia bombarda]|uniref:Uncharacterized protein n=1 Tax=Bombardia bombarda TaxID=252184 RepID=A0AA39XAW0_9PEZI|nr:hypothetical protein B0T17DRAFT_598170 [Bombardia bombarda]